MREGASTQSTEKKKRARFNSADVMIFLLCVLCIAGMVFRFVLIDKIENDAASQSAAVTVLIEGVSETSRQYLTDGTTVYLEDGTTVLGTVSAVTATPSPVYIYEDDGTITKMDSVDGRIDIKVQISALGSLTEQGFMLGGTRYIVPNMTLPVKTSMLDVSVLIMDVSIAQ